MGVDVQLTAEELEDATRLAIRSAEGERYLFSDKALRS